MGHYALLVIFMLITFSANSELDECQDFKTDVFICLNEGADSVYARYGREYKVSCQELICSLCRLKKSEWFIDEKGKKDMSYKCTYEHTKSTRYYNDNMT